jgi:hypothetical protein
VRVLRWICGVKLKPKAVNKLLPYFILHELDKPGSSATVSIFPTLLANPFFDIRDGSGTWNVGMGSLLREGSLR